MTLKLRLKTFLILLKFDGLLRLANLQTYIKHNVHAFNRFGECAKRVKFREFDLARERQWHGRFGYSIVQWP